MDASAGIPWHDGYADQPDVKVILAGPGAFGVKHLEALKSIEGVEVVALVGENPNQTKAVAQNYGIKHVASELLDALALPGVDAAILCTPTQMHAKQAIQCLRSGVNVQVEIPLADNWIDVNAVAELQIQTGLVCMVGHTRRFNPSHQWIHQRIRSGGLNLQHLVAQTFFLRRENVNARGEPRSWVDHLLWHHAAHTVDLFHYQEGGEIVGFSVMQGPRHPVLGISMDMSIQLKSISGALCTLALSFNNDGPLGSKFRYICDNGTYIAHYDSLVDGHNKPVDILQDGVSLSGIEIQDREFFSSIREGSDPRSGVAQVFPAYETLHKLQQSLDT